MDRKTEDTIAAKIFGSVMIVGKEQKNQFYKDTITTHYDTLFNYE
ncbi:MAG: hypothetical protein ACLQQ4_07155 [Bacteroidia bacterium]